MRNLIFAGRWPRPLQWMAGGVAVCAFVAAMSLMGGCAPSPTTIATDFYIAHLQDPHAIWFCSTPNAPAPLTIAALPLGTSVVDLRALRFNGTSDWLYVLTTANNLRVLEMVGSTFQSLATINTGLMPFALDIDGGASLAYVSNTAADSVTVISLTTYQPVGTIALPAGSQPRGIALTPDGKKLYVARAGAGALAIVDTAARIVTGSITVGSQPNRLTMSPNGHELYVANSGSGGVSVIDVLSDTVSTTLNGLADTQAVSVNATGSAIWAGQGPVGSGAGSATRFDTTTLTPTASPAVTASNPVYMLGYASDSFLAVNRAAGTVGQFSSTNNGNALTVGDLASGVAPSAVAIVRMVNRAPVRPGQTQCKLTVAIVGNGTVSASPPSSNGIYNCGTTVTLTASASGSVFAFWSGDLTGNTNPATLLMNTDKNVTATFSTATVTAVYSNQSVGGNIILIHTNTSTVTATNLRVNSVVSNTPNIVFDQGVVGNPGLTFPWMFGNLGAGQSTGHNFGFRATSGSIDVPFSFTIKFQADDMAEQTVVVQVPFPR